MAESFVVYMEVNGSDKKVRKGKGGERREEQEKKECCKSWVGNQGFQHTFGRKALLVGGAIAVAMLLAVALSGNDEVQLFSALLSSCILLISKFAVVGLWAGSEDGGNEARKRSSCYQHGEGLLQA